MIVSVASGKGGTGKTMVAVNLAGCAPEPVLLLDCDVEEPNCHLFFASDVRKREPVSIPVPVLDPVKCNACGLCSRICEFNAIAFLGDRPLVFPELCHGCGGCIRVCRPGALTEVGSGIGVVEVTPIGPGTLVSGRLEVGKALSPPLIHAVRRHADPARLTIIDSPPGTACPLVAAVAGADLALLVAEPTRFGLHDLRLVVQSIRELGVPIRVVVNRSRGEDAELMAYCREEGLDVLLALPESRDVAAACARGHLVAEDVPGMRRAFEDLWTGILRAAADRGPPAPAGAPRPPAEGPRA